MMWRYVGGGVAALVVVAACAILWSSLASSKMPIPEPSAVGSNPVAAALDNRPVPEASERTREERRFARYDRDRNGAVGRDEYLLNRRKSYARLDTDGDGTLSFDEYAAKAVDKFKGADRDRTGSLNPAEFAATKPARKSPPRRNCPPPARSAPADAGDDDA